MTKKKIVRVSKPPEWFDELTLKELLKEEGELEFRMVLCNDEKEYEVLSVHYNELTVAIILRAFQVLQLRLRGKLYNCKSCQARTVMEVERMAEGRLYRCVLCDKAYIS